MGWLVAISHPQKESYAAQQLRNQGCETYVPFCVEDRVSRGKKTAQYVPLMRRYFLFNPMGLPIRTVLSTRGIRSIVTQGDGSPAKVSNAEYERWVEQSSAVQDFRRKAALYVIGQTVSFQKYGQTFTGIICDIMKSDLRVEINPLEVTRSGGRIGVATVRVDRNSIMASEPV
jgi:hypothetical protein